MLMWIIAVTIAVVVLAAAYEVIAFQYLPKHIFRARKKSGYDATITRLRILGRLPSLAGAKAKLHTWFYLGDMLYQARRYAEALEPLRAVCSFGTNPLDPPARKRIAECLDALGRPDEAARERLAAGFVADAIGNPLLSAKTKAEMFSREQKYDEACQQYELAMGLATGPDFRLKRTLRLKLTLANMNAGHPSRVLGLSEQGLLDDPDPLHKIIFHRMAGLACANLGRLEIADIHSQKAYDAAVQLGNTNQQADSLGVLAYVRHQQGRLDEAIDLSRRAVEAAGEIGNRVANTCLFETLMTMGRYQDAQNAISQSRESTVMFVPSKERRSTGAMNLGLARAAGELGNFNQALDLVASATKDFQNNSMSAYCDSIRFWLLAERGDAASEWMVATESKVKSVDSPGAQRDIFGMLTRGALATGDYALGLRFAMCLLDLGPHPVDLPRAHYLIGECRRGLGEIDAARSAFNEAIGLGIETIWTKRARERLAEMADV